MKVTRAYPAVAPPVEQPLRNGRFESAPAAHTFSFGGRLGEPKRIPLDEKLEETQGLKTLDADHS
jgi:hypothetical protein